MIDLVRIQCFIGLDNGWTDDGRTGVDGPGEQLVTEVITLLRQVIGDDPKWAGRVTPSARLDLDLRMDSLEVTALASRLRDAYGDGVDLAAYLAGLDFDALVALTVADIAGYVSACDARAGR
jgi:tocopherol O-methyltransferase